MSAFEAVLSLFPLSLPVARSTSRRDRCRPVSFLCFPPKAARPWAAAAFPIFLVSSLLPPSTLRTLLISTLVHSASTLLALADQPQLRLAILPKLWLPPLFRSISSFRLFALLIHVQQLRRVFLYWSYVSVPSATVLSDFLPCTLSNHFSGRLALRLDRLQVHISDFSTHRRLI